jgi:hypothetical protein
VEVAEAPPAKRGRGRPPKNKVEVKVQSISDDDYF